VAPDHRGHGHSDKPKSDDAYSFEILADDSMALADALGWERFTLLGHSMGGMVAQLMATTAPQRLTGLVLMDTGHGPVDGLDADLVAMAVGIVRDQGMEAFADLMADLPSPLDTPAHRRLLTERPGYAEYSDHKLRTSSADLYAALAPRFLDTPDRLEALRRLPAALTTLVMVGDQDLPFIGASERMAEAIPDATLTVIPDAGHSPQFENPEAWWTSLSEFLDRIASEA
jgi:pimeloyl-ACP methyl ester carboxylesterase